MFIPGPDMPLSHEETAESWAGALVGDNLHRCAKDWKAALLAMPFDVPTASSCITAQTIAVKQYALIDLEREGLIEFVFRSFIAANPVAGYMNPAATTMAVPSWKCTPFGEKVVALLKEMEAKPRPS